MRIGALRRYAVKSLGASPESCLTVEPWGPAGDRRYAVVDTAGRRVSAREAPVMLSLRATPLGMDGVRITTAAGESVDVPAPRSGPPVPVHISGMPTAVDAGDEASRLLCDALGRPVRLVWQPDPSRRPVDPGSGGFPGDVLSLADAGPLLLTSQESLARLQEWVGAEPELSMWRFRPNVVVCDTEPFAEDAWTSVRLGVVDFRVQHACDRCVMTTIDPLTQAKGPEPIRTLARHRKRDGKVWFGIWLVPRGTGTIAVGDAAVPMT